MGHRRLTTLWRRTSFSFKFAAVLAVAVVLIAVVPLVLANSEAHTEALDRAADKAGIAQNLVQEQRDSLGVFAGAVARQVSGATLSDPVLLAATLEEDAGVNPGGDVLAVSSGAGGVTALQGRARLADGSSLVAALAAGVGAGAGTAADADGHPWLVAESRVPGSAATAFVARPITDSVLSAIENNLATGADQPGLALTHGGRAVLGGSLGSSTVVAGTRLDSSVLFALSSGHGPALVSIGGRGIAVATSDIGMGFRLLVSTSVGSIAISPTVLLVLATLVLLALIVIVLVVQIDLRAPLRSLDSAVEAVGRGDFDEPLALQPEGELGRLAATFEAMRSRLQTLMRATNARAAVAAELNSAQPLNAALAKVCGELRRSTCADAVLVLCNGGEMSEPFAIVDGIPVDLDVNAFLRSDGPLGSGYEHRDACALIVSAAPGSAESRVGMRDFCVAPLRVGEHGLGVLALANADRGFTPSDAELVHSAAEQMAMALERYNMIAVVQRQASVDDLTGLHNHRFLVDYLAQQEAIAERLGTPLALLMLDLDNFKLLNDTHGHQAGDAALAAFADTLRHCVRRSDLAARYGGEEFAVVMANTNADQARVVAEKIRGAAAATTVSVDSRRPRLSITVSVGGASFPESTGDAGDLLRIADEALYHSKRAGRNRVTMAAAQRRPEREARTMRVRSKSGQLGAAVGAGGTDRPEE